MQAEKRENVKINKKLLYIIFVIVVSLISALSVLTDGFWGLLPEYQSADKTGFQVHYIDVGQGDCTLILCDGESLLIDAGENGHETKVINYLRSCGIKKLNYIVASHQHSDHIGGLPEVLEEFGTDTIIMPKLTKDQTPTNRTYTAFLEAIRDSGAKGEYSKVGAVYSLGSAKFEILGPIDNDVESINSMSVIVKVTYGENTFMFTGDAEKDEETDVVNSGADLDCDVLKVGHHGSYTSSCKAFLDAVTPEICVIMCGEDNDYGHPHDVVLKRLEKYTDEIFRTDICGSIVIESDGKNLSVSYENE